MTRGNANRALFGLCFLNGFEAFEVNEALPATTLDHLDAAGQGRVPVMASSLGAMLLLAIGAVRARRER